MKPNELVQHQKNITEYLKGLLRQIFLWNRFNSLTTTLENLILNLLSDKILAIKVASKFEDVLRRCDEIDYSEGETTVAYCILHFLPKYRMFQMIYSKLLSGNLSIEKRTGNSSPTRFVAL